jgi:vacuolar protein sorting-associated protein 33A
MCRDLGAHFDYTTLIMPRKMKTCELLLENAGLLGDVSVRGCPLNWVPLEEDILSLEAPAAFRDLTVEGDTSCLWDIAHALTALQSSRGSIPHIKGKGIWAARVQKIMSRMRKELGVAAPAPGGVDGSIDTLVIIDRSVDMVTPMCTQLTYEGLLDEILGLNYGQIRTTGDHTMTSGAGGSGSGAGASSSSSSTAIPANTGDRKVSGLTSADPVFHATRDLFYVGARKWLNETLRSIQQFKEVGMAGADITQLKGFVAELKDKFARIPLHTTLTEQLGEALRAPSFAVRQRIEAALLDEQDDFLAIEDVIAQGENLLPLLRLLCLYCTIHGGIPKKHWDTLRRDLVNTYGHEQLITLRALGKAGLLKKRDGKRTGSFSAAKPAFKLLMQEGETVDEEDPKDIHFTYAGYAPLSVRLVQQALSPGGWSGAGSFGGSSAAAVEAAVAALPGPQFELLQTIDDKGRPIERRERTSSSNGATSVNIINNIDSAPTTAAVAPRKRTVMVAFIGGVTLAEVSALRFLSRKEMVDCEFIIATTKIVNGSSLLASLLPSKS